MSMSDRIDPGPGWRLLKAGEVKPQGCEYYRGATVEPKP